MNEYRKADISAAIKGVEDELGRSISASELKRILSSEWLSRLLLQEFRRTFDENVVFAASSAGQEPASFARRIKLVALIESYRLEAKASKSLVDGKYEVRLYLGLLILVRHFFTLLSLRIGVMAVDGHGQIDAKTSVEYQVAEARKMVGCFRAQRILDYEGIPDCMLLKHQTHFVARMSNAAEQFIIGHELGHVVHWEAGSGHPSLVWGREIFERLRKRKNSPLTSKHYDGWHEEFGADYYGLSFALEREKEPFGLAVAVAGAEGVLMILRLLETYKTQYAGLSETHPPAQLRLEALRICVGQLPPFYFEIGKGLDFMLLEITKRL